MFDKLKKLFVIEDENAVKEVQATKKAEPASKVKEPKIEVDLPKIKTSADYDTPDGKADPKFIDILLKSIEKNNLEGFDYLEYKSSLQGLDDMAMDEATRYKSAFVMAKTMGVTPTKLLSSAKHYVGVLNKEEKKFIDALKNQRQKQVVGKEEKLVALQKEVTAKKAQIEKLKKEIAANEASFKTIKDGINKSAAKVEKTNDRFMHAYKVVLGQIMTDVENMKKYLK